MSEVSIPDLPQLDSLPTAPDQSAGEQFLRLRLTLETTVLLPVQQLSEVLTVSIGQIIPLPHLPAWVGGVYNWRGEILWIIDLAQFCGLSRQRSPRSAESVVVLEVTIATERQSLGLVVAGVEEIEFCHVDTIQSSLPANLSNPIPQPLSGLAPFVQGYWQPPHQAAIAILEGRAILAAMPQP